jgi:hypothetical protein
MKNRPNRRMLRITITVITMILTRLTAKSSVVKGARGAKARSGLETASF